VLVLVLVLVLVAIMVTYASFFLRFSQWCFENTQR
jgi:hypothetical protein